jgi:transcriptional regulator with XRE-family HTH domain
MSTDPDPIDVHLGAHIRARRKSMGLSQGRLAAAVGVSFQQIQKYERGANRVSVSMLVHIAAILKTSAAVLLEQADKPAADQPPPLLRGLQIAGAPQMLAAYAAISEPGVRRALLVLAT